MQDIDRQRSVKFLYANRRQKSILKAKTIVAGNNDRKQSRHWPKDKMHPD
ncbi:MAG: hypothetical protein AAGA28_08645 [Pseudomonadota bacterium]